MFNSWHVLIAEKCIFLQIDDGASFKWAALNSNHGPSYRKSNKFSFELAIEAFMLFYCSVGDADDGFCHFQTDFVEMLSNKNEELHSKRTHCHVATP